MRTVVPPSGVILAENGRRANDHGARVAAGMHQISVEAYRAHEAADEHWCRPCGLWLPRRAFYVDSRATRGADSMCKAHRRIQNHAQQRGSRHRGVSYAGPAFARRVYLTPEGAAVATTISDTAWSGRCAQNAAAVPSGHPHCPPSIHQLCLGQLPDGWVRGNAS